MSNFARQFPIGVPANGILPSGKADYWDVAISKAVNGDDGSSHAGFVQLGQIKSSHVTSKLAVATVLTQNVTIANDVNTNAQLEIVNQGIDEDKAWTLNFTNVLSGDILVVTLDATPTMTSAHKVVLTWGGAGLVHRFSGGDSQPLPGPCRTLWVGRATSAATTSTNAAEIWWTCTRY